MIERFLVVCLRWVYMGRRVCLGKGALYAGITTGGTSFGKSRSTGQSL